jgi:hypothetical protein
MKTARLFLALFALGVVGAYPAAAQIGAPPWEYWQDVNAPITDFSSTASSITITDPFTISNMQVMVDIQHTSASDLLITLSSPAGNFVLSQYNGGVFDNYENTIFDPAVLPFPCSGAIPAGASRPLRERSDESVRVLSRRVQAAAGHRVSDFRFRNRHLDDPGSRQCRR